MKSRSRSLFRSLIYRAHLILPPILFLAYATHGLMTIRSLMSVSSSFHLDYANDLVQDFLANEIERETLQLRNGLLLNEPVDTLLVTLVGKGTPVSYTEDGGKGLPVYARHDKMKECLPVFISSSKGLSALTMERYHEAVYWYRILDPQDNPVYISGKKSEDKQVMATYPMDRSLVDYKIEIIYNSFGPKQLYSVARTKINFGAILLLFVLAVFSALLLTRSIRQKLVLARQKTFFVSTVSHEFKTPLAIMKLATETLAAKRFKSEQEEQRFRAMLTNEINRLDMLVHKILSFNKIEMDQVAFHNQRLDLRQILETTIEVFSARADSEGVDLVLDMCPSPCMIDGDADLIRHAVDNILDNGFKYRGESTRIEMVCQPDKNGILLSVRDQGIGIAAEEIPHIQKSFYRIHDPVLQGVRGSGLGLAISGYILKRSGAKLSINSTPGKGSTFTITFPHAGPTQG